MFDAWTSMLPATGADPIPVVRRAAASDSVPPARRGRWLAVLAVLLHRHYRRCGDPADLDEAVTAGRAALEVLPVADASRAAAVSALAGTLALRFRERGRLTDLGEALALTGTANPPTDGGTDPAATDAMAVLLAWARFHVSGVAPPGIPGPVRRSGEDLRGVPLRGERLRYADLSGADLTGADLTDADLTGANLAGARLAGARLAGAVLDRTVLCGADLTGAWLPGTDLRTAHLAGAVVHRTMLLGSDLPPGAVRERTLPDGGPASAATVGGLPARRRRRSRIARYFRDAQRWLPPVVAADAGVAGLVVTVDAAGVVGLWDAAARVPLRWMDDLPELEHWNAEQYEKARTNLWRTGSGRHSVQTVTLSPDGATIAAVTSTVSSEYAYSLSVRLFDTASGRPIGQHSCGGDDDDGEHEQVEEDVPPRVGVAFSPDGRQLVVTGTCTDVQMLLVPPTLPPDDLHEGHSPAATVAWRGTHPDWKAIDGPLRYSPDGRRLAVSGRPFVSDPTTAAVWELDPRTGAELFHADAGGGDVLAVGYLADGRLAAVSGSATGWSGRIWRTGDEDPADSVESLSETGPIACAAFAPDGGSVALATVDGVVEVRDLPAWRRRWRSSAGPAVTGLRFSPDGGTLAGTGTDPGTGTGIENGTRMWDTASGAERQRSARTALAFTGDGHTLITAGAPPILLDTGSGAPVGSLDPEPADADGWRLSGLCLFPADFPADAVPAGSPIRPEAGVYPLRHDALLLGGGWTHLSVPPRWWPGGTTGYRVLQAYDDARVAFSADGRLVAVPWNDRVFVWPLDGLDTGPLVGPMLDPTVTADSGDDRFIVTYDEDSDEDDEDEDGDDEEEVDDVGAVVFSPDGVLLAATHRSGRVRLWRVADLSPAGPEFDGAVVTAFSPDGRLLAGGGADGVLRLWNLAEPAGTATVHAHDGPVRHLAFAPDGTLIATGGEDGLVRRWDPRTLAPVGAPLPGPGGAVAFLPTDGTLLTGDGDGRVQRWNARTGEPLGQPFGDRPTMPPALGGYQPYRDADTTVESITASPDGRRVATRHGNSGVGLWDPDSGASLLPKWPALAGAVAVVPGSDLLYVGGHLYHLDGPPQGS